MRTKHIRRARVGATRRRFAAALLALAMLASPGYSGQIRAQAAAGEVSTAQNTQIAAVRVDAEVLLWVYRINESDAYASPPAESRNIQVRPGDTVCFRVQVKNVGESAFLPIGFSTELPEGLMLENSAFNERWRQVGRQLAASYAGEPLQPGETCEQDIVATIGPMQVGGAVELAVAASGYLDATGKTADNARSNTAKVAVYLHPGDESSNLKTGMTLWQINGTPAANVNGRITRGDLLTYRITITNLGGTQVNLGRLVAILSPNTVANANENPQWVSNENGLLVGTPGANSLAPGEQRECMLNLRVGARAEIGEVLKVSLHTTTLSDGQTDAQAIRTATLRFDKGDAPSCAVTVGYGDIARTGDDPLSLLIPIAGGTMLMIGTLLLTIKRGKRRA